MKRVFHKEIYFTPTPKFLVLGFILMCSALFLPCSVFASMVYIDTEHSDFFVGDTILFHVRVDSENKNINAVEGEVLMDYPTESVSLVDINTSGSTFSLWPDKPLPSASNASVSFAGGSPGGFNAKDAIIFNIVLKLQQAGQIVLTPENINVYLHDGKGTTDTMSVKNLVINVLPAKTEPQPVDDWSSVLSNDTTPPEPFEIYAGQDGSVFDGKKFLSFSTTDAQSGIAYYEVIEGNLPPTRSSDTYVLHEQNKPVQVTVTAYDSAGNARKALYSTPSYTTYYPVILVFAVLLLVFIIYKKRGYLKNKKSPLQ